MKTLNTFETTRFLSKHLFARDTKRAIRNTMVYDKVLSSTDELTSTKPNAIIRFVNGGSVDTAYALSSKDNRVALLNFANAVTPGGCPKYSTSQEANICQCTNVYETLATKYADEHFYKINDGTGPSGVYTHRLIYTPKAIIFRDSKTFKLINKRYVDIITCPSPSGVYESKFALRVYKTRIEHIILSAIKHNVNTLVLGAWGCGVFAQDPFVMAQAFASVLTKYGCFFDDIIFAIPAGFNYDVFFKQIKKRYVGLVKEVNKDAL